MTPQRNNRTSKMKKARRSLDVMLETLQPYLPRPDSQPPTPVKRWRLSEQKTAAVKPCQNQRDIVI